MDNPEKRWLLIETDKVIEGFPGGSHDKESTCNVGDQGLIPGLGKYSGEENGYPLQYSYLEKFSDRGTWRAIVYGGLKELDVTEQLTHKHIEDLPITGFMGVLQRILSWKLIKALFYFNQSSQICCGAMNASLKHFTHYGCLRTEHRIFI